MSFVKACSLRAPQEPWQAPWNNKFRNSAAELTR